MFHIIVSFKSRCLKCMTLDEAEKYDDATKCFKTVGRHYTELESSELCEAVTAVMEKMTLENRTRVEKYLELACTDTCGFTFPMMYSISYYKRFTEVYELGRPDEALKWLDLSLVNSPNNEKALFAKGMVLAEYHDVNHAHNTLEDAISWYDRAIKADLDYFEAYYNKGMLLKRLGRLKEALECFDNVIRLGSVSHRAFDMKGKILDQMGRNDEAIKCYRRALEIKPDFASAMYNLGSALYYMERVEEAGDLFERAVKLDPELPLISGIREMIKARLEFNSRLHGSCTKEHLDRE